LDVRRGGGHHHVKIEGQYTKASEVYVDGVAERIARAFLDALADKKPRDHADPRGLESVVLNDLLLQDVWKVDASWPWRYPSHINVFESYSLVTLLTL
jgi:hypothetical protein